MKKYLLPAIVALYLLGWSTAYAQPTRTTDQFAFLKRLKVNRINLEERANAQVKLLPHVLLTAYRLGLIQGYYPGTIDGQISWNKFAKIFEIQPHPYDAIGANAMTCCTAVDGPGIKRLKPGELNSEALQDIFYPGMGLVMELIEEEIFDSKRSAQVWNTRYIRLIWVDPKGQLPARNALVFNYEEVAKVLSTVKIASEKNEAVQLSLLQLLIQRQFTAYPVAVSGQELLTKSEVQRRMQQGSDREQEQYRR